MKLASRNFSLRNVVLFIPNQVELFKRSKISSQDMRQDQRTQDPGHFPFVAGLRHFPFVIGHFSFFIYSANETYCCQRQRMSELLAQ